MRNDRFPQWWFTCVHGLVRNLLIQLFRPGELKIEVSEFYVFDNMATHNNHPSFVQHVSGNSCVFFTIFRDSVWWGGGPPNRLVHNLLMQSFTLYS